MRRAFVVVLDACGVGALPDAADYGDEGKQHARPSRARGRRAATAPLRALGLGSVLELGVAPARDPVLHGRLHALGYGKDSTAGHWELMGVVTESPMPTYPAASPPP